MEAKNDEMATIKAISTSNRKGTRKNNQGLSRLIIGHGLADDAHAGSWHRQVSLLAQESIDSMRAKGLAVVAGNFAENITTEGLTLTNLPVGSHLVLGETELIVSQLGKVCHHRCAIYHQAGDCVMPREGIFAVVRRGGTIRVGDPITVGDKRSPTAAVLTGQDLAASAGEEIVAKVNARFGAAFTRLETVAVGEGEKLLQLLDDLRDSQQIADIVVVDPGGGWGLALAGRVPPAGEKFVSRHGTTIHCCQGLAGLAAL